MRWFTPVPSYKGGREREDPDLTPAQAKSSQDRISTSKPGVVCAPVIPALQKAVGRTVVQGQPSAREPKTLSEKH
jgi:hypothetical protein